MSDEFWERIAQEQADRFRRLTEWPKITAVDLAQLSELQRMRALQEAQLWEMRRPLREREQQERQRMAQLQAAKEKHLTSIAIQFLRDTGIEAYMRGFVPRLMVPYMGKNGEALPQLREAPTCSFKICFTEPTHYVYWLEDQFGETLSVSCHVEEDRRYNSLMLLTVQDSLHYKDAKSAWTDSPFYPAPADYHPVERPQICAYARVDCSLMTRPPNDQESFRELGSPNGPIHIREFKFIVDTLLTAAHFHRSWNVVNHS